MASGGRRQSSSLKDDDLADLYEALLSVKNKYKYLGVIIGVSIDEIRSIESQYKDPGERLFEVLAARIRQSEPLTWKYIATVLRLDSIGEGKTADNIQKKYGHLFSPEPSADEHKYEEEGRHMGDRQDESLDRGRRQRLNEDRYGGRSDREDGSLERGRKDRRDQAWGQGREYRPEHRGRRDEDPVWYQSRSRGNECCESEREDQGWNEQDKNWDRGRKHGQELGRDRGGWEFRRGGSLDRGRRDKERQEEDRNQQWKERQDEDRDRGRRERQEQERDRGRRERQEQDRDRWRRGRQDEDRDRERKGRQDEDRDRGRRERQDEDWDRRWRDRKDEDRDRGRRERQYEDWDQRRRERQDEDRDQEGRDRKDEDRDRGRRERKGEDWDRGRRERQNEDCHRGRRERQDEDSDRGWRDKKDEDRDRGWRDRKDEDRDRGWRERQDEDWDRWRRERQDEDWDRERRERQDEDSDRGWRDRKDEDRDRGRRKRQDEDRDRGRMERQDEDSDQGWRKRQDEDRDRERRERQDEDCDRGKRERQDEDSDHGWRDRKDEDRDRGRRKRQDEDRDQGRRKRQDEDGDRGRRERQDEDRDRGWRERQDEDRDRGRRDRQNEGRNRRRRRDRQDEDKDFERGRSNEPVKHWEQDVRDAQGVDWDGWRRDRQHDRSKLEIPDRITHCNENHTEEVHEKPFPEEGEGEKSVKTTVGRKASSSSETDNSSPECDLVTHLSESDKKKLVRIFKCVYGKLCYAMKDPNEMASELQAYRLLSRSNTENILSSPESQQIKANTLVRLLYRKIKSRPTKVFTVRDILIANTSLQELGAKLSSEIGKGLKIGHSAHNELFCLLFPEKVCPNRQGSVMASSNSPQLMSEGKRGCISVNSVL